MSFPRSIPRAAIVIVYLLLWLKKCGYSCATERALRLMLDNTRKPLERGLAIAQDRGYIIRVRGFNGNPLTIVALTKKALIESRSLLELGKDDL